MPPANRKTATSTDLTWRESVEWGRKAFHLSSTVLAIWVLLVDDPLCTVVLAAVSLFGISVDTARLSSRRWALWFYRTFPLIFRRDERRWLTGASVMMIGATITSFLFPAVPAAAGILCLAWGDAAAAIVGQSVSYRRRQLGLEQGDGSRAPVVARRGNKTWAGTGGCFLVSVAVILMVSDASLLLSVAGGVASASMERWTPGRWDNLTMPLASAAVIQFCDTWFV